MGETLQDYNLVSVLKKQVNCCKKKFKETQKIGNPNNNEGNEQVDNKKTTTNNKIMQTQQHGK